MLLLTNLILKLSLIISLVHALPVFRKREIVTRVHTASTTNTVTDFYSTTTEIIVAPTVKFIISGSVTFTTTLTPDNANPTAIPSTMTTVVKNIQPTALSESNDKALNGNDYNTQQSEQNSADQNTQSQGYNSINSVQPTDNSAQTQKSTAMENPATTTQKNVEQSTSQLFTTKSLAPNSEVSSSVKDVESSSSRQASDRTTLQPTTSSSSSSKGVSSDSTSTTTITMTELDTIYTTTYTTSSDTLSQETLTIPTSSKASTSSQSTQSSSSSTSSTQASASSTLIPNIPYSLTYSPYNNDGTCRAAEDVYNDLTEIKAKGVANIRVYGTDCNSLNTVQPAAAKLGIRINQGLYIDSQGVDSIDEGLQDLVNYAKTSGWDIFDYITVGNEAVQSNFCTVDELISKIASVKQTLKAAGYTGQITTSEPPVVFENHPELCTKSEIDFVGINAHSYFDPYSSADTAGQFVKGQVQIVQNACNTANVIVTETGFPSAGIQNGGNIPSPANQYIAIKSILDVMKQSVTILSAYDDKWKAVGPYGIEQSFGILQILA
ncbi:putative family 17 glucosidase SCW11 [Nakaseomyces bracarensis]|uniref:Family 17 glucosidase SCW11 n=1 Tax=Nakaseomyces bracarensis TaxID=273131 RepID=A0ABR4NS31_9SACH